VSDLRVIGRATQGVRLINLSDTDEIASVAKVEVDPEDREAAANSENGGVYGTDQTKTSDEQTGEASSETEGEAPVNPE